MVARAAATAKGMAAARGAATLGGGGGARAQAVLGASVRAQKSGNIFRVGIFLDFVLAHHTYDAPPWGCRCIVRAGSQTKSN